jgi:hypothetical protein
MPTNHYFQAGRGMGTRSEQDLLQQLTNECIKIVGADFVYIPREIVKLDELYHEDTLSKFTRNYSIEMYIENYDAFFGIGPQITNFGFQLNYQLRLICSRERFSQTMGTSIPIEGDLIYYPSSRGLFEIKFIEDKAPLYPLGSRQYFVLACESFKYSNENIDSGTEADEAQTNYKNTGEIIKDPFAKNDEIQDIADTGTDFSEDNPFGKL